MMKDSKTISEEEQREYEHQQAQCKHLIESAKTQPDICRLTIQNITDKMCPKKRLMGFVSPNCWRYK